VLAAGEAYELGQLHERHDGDELPHPLLNGRITVGNLGLSLLDCQTNVLAKHIDLQLQDDVIPLVAVA